LWQQQKKKKKKKKRQYLFRLKTRCRQIGRDVGDRKRCDKQQYLFSLLNEGKKGRVR
jgi:hypothetical protein